MEGWEDAAGGVLDECRRRLADAADLLAELVDRALFAVDRAGVPGWVS